MNNFSGWTVRLGAMGLLGLLVVIVRAYLVFSDLDPQGAEVLRSAISHEYRSYQLARNDLDGDARAHLVASAAEIHFRQMSAHFDGKQLIARVELEPNPAAPPNSPMVRYFRMEHSPLTGWVYVSTSSALSYYTAPISLP